MTSSLSVKYVRGVLRRWPLCRPVDVKTTTGAPKFSLMRPPVAFMIGASSGAPILRQTAAPVLVVPSRPPNHHEIVRSHAARACGSTRGMPLMVSPAMVRRIVPRHRGTLGGAVTRGPADFATGELLGSRPRGDHIGDGFLAMFDDPQRA